MIKSLNIDVEVMVIHKDKFDKETLDLHRRCFTVFMEKEDFYIFISRDHHVDPGVRYMIDRNSLYLSELLCEYNVDITLPTIDVSNLKRYQYLNTISKLLTKENVQLKSINIYKARRLSFLEDNIEVTNNTIMDDVKSSLYNHCKDSESSKQPLANIVEDIPEGIFSNIKEIFACNINGLLKAFE